MFDLINEGQTHSRYFKISKSRIAQMEYWRSLRNDCVHSKDNLIVAAHVESFWLFIQSILPKLVINGSKDFLLSELEDYFDNVYFNYPHKVQDIVRMIPHLAENNNISELFGEIHDHFKGNRNYRFSDSSGKAQEFWKTINSSENLLISNNLNKFLIQSNEIFQIFIMHFPERFLKCYAEKQPVIIKFINQDLPFWLRSNSLNAVSILCTCIRNKLLNSKESKRLVAHVSCDLKALTDEEIMLLKDHGFFENIKENMMKDLHNGKSFSYSNINGKSVELSYFVKYCLMTDDDGERFTTLLNNTLVDLKNSSVFRELKEVLTQNPDILQYIKSVIGNEGQELCEFFAELQ
ncbi:MULTISPECIES: hypothetical protein [Bacillus cereus group]|uniref:Uncharacterized protein n=1 Tax=Bacillus thuringiensis serovar toumanoffi TaxID=180862 RepID=A0ABD5I966_BACTU|nr:hypothetical protein [Bacillus thuringiensis]MCU5279092.1 hypothetical protein [Bacillus cereus]EEM92737.1 hypothetical protein bthur0013_59090 [Bacillus thuringiensis IBL 200]KIP25771.1 hypothetical protein BG10_4996 [Bacillus thuringiensis serovar morrisoni]MCR6783679.1 hypothetical protein [Bacillus thuringiensis]MCR6862008.1 hypothetical protein [Bacillus thuringiensis]